MGECTVDKIRQKVEASYPKTKNRELIYRTISQQCEALACIRFLTNEAYRHYDDIERAIEDIAQICEKWGIDYKAIVQRTFTKT